MPHRRGAFLTRLTLSALAGVSVCVLDRLTKIWALGSLRENQSQDVWAPWLAWTLHRNTGAAFGLGAHAPDALIWFAAGLTIFLAVWWLKTAATPGKWIESLALALILGGSAGNLTDRFRTGAVIDFIDFKVWPIFNLADSAITAGAVLWAACVILRRNQIPKD